MDQLNSQQIGFKLSECDSNYTNSAQEDSAINNNNNNKR